MTHSLCVFPFAHSPPTQALSSLCTLSLSHSLALSSSPPSFVLHTPPLDFCPGLSHSFSSKVLYERRTDLATWSTSLYCIVRLFTTSVLSPIYPHFYHPVQYNVRYFQLDFPPGLYYFTSFSSVLPQLYNVSPFFLFYGSSSLDYLDCLPFSFFCSSFASDTPSFSKPPRI